MVQIESHLVLVLILHTKKLSLLHLSPTGVAWLLACKPNERVLGSNMGRTKLAAESHGKSVHYKSDVPLSK